MTKLTHTNKESACIYQVAFSVNLPLPKRRLQLLKAVISSMYVFWSSMLSLPTSTIKDLEAKMRLFLWNKNENGKTKSKVAWALVCRPISEGGLGIRRINDVNRSLMASHIWSIVTHRKSVWVEWAYDNKLRANSLWDVPMKRCMSWGWRKILQIREEIRPFISCNIGNGLSTLIWNDNWCSHSPLCNYITTREIYRAGFGINDKLVDLVDNRQWIWASAWDTYVWRDRHGNERDFSSSLVWNIIRDMQHVVDWEKMVWFPYCIPRHAFHMWLVFLGKLNTQDRMKKWDMNMMCCVFCYKGMDSHEHLFFECDYSREVWHLIRPRINMQNIEGSWEDIRHRINSRLKVKSARSIIERLIVGAASYYVWQERNARLFQKELRSANQLSEVIFKTVQFRLMSISFKGTRGNKQLLDRWNIKVDMQMDAKDNG
ncbi:hypothetical protein QVD17_00105 [Tagetes erecta]|uniref:Reverse transcriptase zinc-binding domain-containing protein n=1 Tax=Tagetes erecta TaxID=13708 RepID=A0AAD8L802_TARER|nr:hypothetical protein QVD17_00105 [Tagetes erecta]